jgi:Trypsin
LTFPISKGTFGVAVASLSIRTGSNNVKLGDITAVSAVTRHPLFDVLTKNFNIAALKLATALILNGVTKSAIGLPTFRWKPFSTGDKVYVTGWGNMGNGSPATFLRGIVIPIVNHQECKTVFEETEDVITNQMICAGEPGKNVCLVR